MNISTPKKSFSMPHILVLGIKFDFVKFLNSIWYGVYLIRVPNNQNTSSLFAPCFPWHFFFCAYFLGIFHGFYLSLVIGFRLFMQKIEGSIQELDATRLLRRLGFDLIFLINRVPPIFLRWTWYPWVSPRKFKRKKRRRHGKLRGQVSWKRLFN